MTKQTDNEMNSGILYLVATPIGNLEDMTYRAVRILQEADLIAAEDTRNSIHLLRHFDIETPMTSYHEHNKIDKAHTLIDKLQKGQSVALITDAGTPGISDPGEELVRMCLDEGIRVVPVPGASAVITALIASGRPTRRFAFEAFLPKNKKERKRVLEEVAAETRTIVLYEAPHHLADTLGELASVLGPDRPLTVCRELTKRFETYTETTIGEAAAALETEPARGEYVLVIEGRDKDEVKAGEQEAWKELSVAEHVAMYEETGIDRKEAMRLAAKDRGVSRRDIYNALI